MPTTSKAVDLSIPSPELISGDRFLKAAEACVIESAEDSLDAQKVRASINGQLKDHTDQRMAITRKIDAAKKAVMDLFEPTRATLERALRILDEKIIDWDNLQERRRREAQRQLDDAAAAERARLQAIADAAEAKGQETKATKFAERAQNIVAPIVQSEAPRAAGVAIAKRWTSEVIDAAKINRAFLTPDLVKIGKTVRAMGLEAKELIGEGIEIRQEKSLSSGRAAR